MQAIRCHLRANAAGAPTPRARQAGFTLIEVLVAVLVLSFGMLGVVGLQVSAMQANKEARYQSAGVRYGRELAETMRANKTVMALATSAYILDSNSAAPAAFSCPASCASRADLSKQDMSDWWSRASAELPGLRLVVCPDANPYDASGIAQWACTAPASTSAGQSLFVKLAWTQQTVNKAAATADIFNRAAIPLVVIPVVN